MLLLMGVLPGGCGGLGFDGGSAGGFGDVVGGGVVTGGVPAGGGVVPGPPDIGGEFSLPPHALISNAVATTARKERDNEVFDACIVGNIGSG